MSYRTPSRFPKGINAEVQGSFSSMLPVPNLLEVHPYFNDFDTYQATDWTITASTGTNALVAGNGGILRMTTAAAVNDVQAIVKNPAAFAFVGGNQVWFMASLNVSDNTSAFNVGLIAGGTPMIPLDGVFFQKVAGSANIDLVIRKAGASTTLAAVTTIGAATQTPLAFYYDGRAEPTIYVYSGTPAIAAQANVAFGQPYFVGGAMVGGTQVMTNLPIVNLSQAVVFQTPTGVKTLDVDYLMAINEVVRY
jgi:hypothetical protein